MSRREPDTRRRGPPEERPSGTSSKRWVVGSGTIDCDHPEEALTRLGGDGLNGYYQCERCEAGVVVQDEVADLV